MRSEELKHRSKRFSVDTFNLVRRLPETTESRTVGIQLFRSATSVAANYRAACRARSRREFVSKIGLVVEEADESVFWLEFLTDAEIVSQQHVRPFLTEANELLAIFAASQVTARRNLKHSG